MKLFTIPLVASVVLLSPSQHASAVEVLSAKELASHCKVFPGENISYGDEFCARYIQGFIDGAVATDARVMLNVEAEYNRKTTLVERALRTRLPGRAEYLRAAHYAGFCLGDPVPLKEVVANVVNDLNQRDQEATKGLAPTDVARDIVYMSLKKHYPCEPE